MLKNSPFAFPTEDADKYHHGMTLRQWYAGMALQGLIAHEGPSTIPGCREKDAKFCFEQADAMIEEGSL
jgi:hypothetical protein